MRRYLLVDDNEALADNLAEIIICEQGSEVCVAATGAEALRLLRGPRFDAVVTDMRMPGMCGADLLGRIRSMDAGLPAIVMSAYASEAEMLAAHGAGLLAVISKPVPLARLLALLARARRSALVALIECELGLADDLVEGLRARGFSTVAIDSATEQDKLVDLAPFVALIPAAMGATALRHLQAHLPLLRTLDVTAYAKERSSQGTPHQEKRWAVPSLLEAIEQCHQLLPLPLGAA